MLKIVTFTLAFFIVVVASGRAEPLTYNGPLSLAQALARVRDADFDVRLAQAGARSARAQALGQQALTRPQLSVAATALNANLPQLGMPVARQAYVSAIASLPLLVTNQRLGYLAGNFSADATSASVGEARNNAAFAAIQIYRRAQLGQALIDARSVALIAERSHLRNTELRVTLGKSARYLLARDRASLAAAQQNLEDATAQRDEAVTELAAALDYSISSNIVIADSLQPVSFVSTEKLALAKAMNQRPAVQAARVQLEAALARTSEGRATSLPTITANAQSYNGTSSPMLGAAGFQIGVTVNVPVFDGGARRATVAQGAAEVQRAEAMVEQTELFAQRDVANSYRELKAASINLQAARTGLSSASEQLRVAQLREAAGKGIVLEALDALSVAANARENELMAVARYDNAVASVQHATGDLSI